MAELTEQYYEKGGDLDIRNIFSVNKLNYRKGFVLDKNWFHVDWDLYLLLGIGSILLGTLQFTEQDFESRYNELTD